MTTLTDAAPDLLAALKETASIVEGWLTAIIECNCAQGADGKYDLATLPGDWKRDVKRFNKALAAARKAIADAEQEGPHVR